jgi:hypothetical protein
MLFIRSTGLTFLRILLLLVLFARFQATFIEYGQLNKFVAEVAPLLIHSSVSSLASNAIHFYERCCFPG